MQDRWMGSMTISKFLFSAMVLVVCTPLLHAEKRFMIQASTQSAPLPQFKEWVTQAAYYSSATCVASSLTNVVISTTPSYLHAIFITSATVGSGVVEAFDAQGSTTTARRISAPIDTRSIGQWPFNVYASSGIAVSNQATLAPACIDIIYSEK